MAECIKKVQLIKEGQIATCSGFLFSDEAEKEAAEARDEAKALKHINTMLERKSEFLQKENDTANERLQNFITQNRALADKVTKDEIYSDLQKLIYFALGVGVTSFIVSNVNK